MNKETIIAETNKRYNKFVEVNLSMTGKEKISAYYKIHRVVAEELAKVNHTQGEV